MGIDAVTLDSAISGRNEATSLCSKERAFEGSSRSAIFLDRDGVINRVFMRNGKPYSPRNLEELEIPTETYLALDALKAAGFILIVVTNQPDVARGIMRREEVEAIHDRIRAELPIEIILTCYHDEQDNCTCRKPQPGMLLQAAQAYAINLQSSFIIGDRWRDIEAGQRAGCRTIFIDYHYDERQPKNPTWRVNSLTEAAALIMKSERI